MRELSGEVWLVNGGQALVSALAVVHPDAGRLELRHLDL